MEAVSRSGYERDVEVAEAGSSARAFAEAWAEGRVTDFDEAVTSALAAAFPCEPVSSLAASSAGAPSGK